MILSIIAVFINNFEITKRFLSSIRQYTNVDYELILIDNGSTDKKAIKFNKKAADIYYRFNQRTHLAKAWNKGFSLSKGKFIAIVNNDVIVPQNWFELLKETFDKNEKAGMVSPLTFWIIKGFFQYNRYPNFDKSFNKPFKLEKFKDVIWGEFCVFKRKSFIDVGGYNPVYKDLTAEDLEICFQLYSKEYEIYVDPRVFVYHEGNATVRLLEKNKFNQINDRNFNLFKSRWPQYTGDWH